MRACLTRVNFFPLQVFMGARLAEMEPRRYEQKVRNEAVVWANSKSVGAAPQAAADVDAAPASPPIFSRAVFTHEGAARLFTDRRPAALAMKAMVEGIEFVKYGHGAAEGATGSAAGAGGALAAR
jgi:hypothetical protein